MPTPSDAALDVLLAQLLRCPACAERPALRVVETDDKFALLCETCGRTYPVENGVPFLLVESNDGEKSEMKSNAAL